MSLCPNCGEAIRPVEGSKDRSKCKCTNWVGGRELMKILAPELLSDPMETERFLNGPYRGRRFTADGLREVHPDGTETVVPDNEKWLVGD